MKKKKNYLKIAYASNSNIIIITINIKNIIILYLFHIINYLLKYVKELLKYFYTLHICFLRKFFISLNLREPGLEGMLKLGCILTVARSVLR